MLVLMSHKSYHHSMPISMHMPLFIIPFTITSPVPYTMQSSPNPLMPYTITHVALHDSPINYFTLFHVPFNRSNQSLQIHINMIIVLSYYFFNFNFFHDRKLLAIIDDNVALATNETYITQQDI
jgi:hypothetical protein